MSDRIASCIRAREGSTGFQPTDSTKDYIAFKSKLDNIKSIIKKLDILQNDYCALPDKVNLKDSLDTLSDLQDEAEKTKLSFLVLLPPTNKSILTDEEDNSAGIPLAKRSKRYNPPAIHVMAFTLAIPG
ncbi:hypothetical protein TNCV_1981381 [Trichonephila clavipes]|nr:hypothetical protein TNCV_1981381 [Trichonephila clavipes]